MKNLRMRVVISLVVLVTAGWFFYPLYPYPFEGIRLKLGLDLKGGVHLVLRVNTDDALRLDTETTMEQLREAVDGKGISGAVFSGVSPTQFKVEGIPQNQDGAFREAANEVQVSFNRESGVGGTYTFTMKPNIIVQLREDAVTQARQTIERRVNELGVAEPVIAQTGANNDQIIVELPGITEVARAEEIIRSTALLELKLVEDGPASTKESLLQSRNGAIPNNMEVVPGVGDSSQRGERAETVFYLIRKVAVVTGRDLRNAKPTIDTNGRPAVSFTLNQDGARKFGKATGENIGRRLAIILDGRVQSAPNIEGRIDDNGQISGGSFTQQEVQDLSLVLRSGALPASLTYLEKNTVGPTLGADSIRSGIIASAVGLILIMLFMLAYYKLSGVNAVVALSFNLAILLGLMAYLGATMTLPGIAGFVLTMGIGVDSNVLIFERIKEELAAQRGVRQAVDAGFSRVFLTLLDTHIASLISAAFLFQFGTGPIRGFATTLSIGLVSNLFTSTFVSKTIFELVLSGRKVQTLSI
ncbi:MAG: protein translocase subunit SecD [Acidobacteria bacterium]|nr:protein translocase subunit SecD [Acidobacteriota bacterium]